MSANDTNASGSDQTPLPRRRALLAGLAGLGLAGMSPPPVRDEAKAAVVRRRLDAWLKVVEEEDAGTFNAEQAEWAAGLAVVEYLGLSPHRAQMCGVEYGGRLYVVESNVGGDEADFSAVIDVVPLANMGEV